MRLVIQRVSQASVTVEEKRCAEIGAGLLVLLGITHDDSSKDVDFLVDKCVNLRIFEDENGKMNRSLKDIDGEMIVVSQFTLYGDASHGRRPSFIEAARPEVAIPLYEEFIAKCKPLIKSVGSGIFGADMKVELLNDGPVTIVVESRR